MSAAFAGRCGHERNWLAIEPGFAHQQARWHRNAHPSIFQNVDSQGGAACRKIAGNAQVGVNPAERSVERWRFGIVLDGICLCPEHPIFVDWNDDPSGNVRGFRWFVLSLRYDSPINGSGNKAENEATQSKASELQDDGAD